MQRSWTRLTARFQPKDDCSYNFFCMLPIGNGRLRWSSDSFRSSNSIGDDRLRSISYLFRSSDQIENGRKFPQKSDRNPSARNRSDLDEKRSFPSRIRPIPSEFLYGIRRFRDGSDDWNVRPGFLEHIRESTFACSRYPGQQLRTPYTTPSSTAVLMNQVFGHIERESNVGYGFISQSRFLFCQKSVTLS